MGRVYLIGVEPGDPDLITVKGMKAIQASDVILHDRLVSKEILDFTKPHTKFFYCGKDSNKHSLPQEETNRMLVNLAKKGHATTRLRDDNPFVFRHGGEEAEILSDNQIPSEIVPGITSGIAVPAYAGIPATHGDYNSSVAFVTAVNKPGMTERVYWEYLARGSKILCVYMGVKHLPEIYELLARHSKSVGTSVALIHLETTISQETVTRTLGGIVQCASGIKNPAMVVVGDMANMHQKISWFKEQVSGVEMTLP